MAGPRYTKAQTRARIAALTISADHLETALTNDEIEKKQFEDVAQKLRNEATRLALKRQDVEQRGKLLQQTERTQSHTRSLFSAAAADT